ncbi:MAG: class I SAM-dependent methyltransferase [Bacteroidales bacterium]|jgi:SAM-dependent methyltransferase|nr:class I SAM-dependent methyltransferase [Bacteroidales bacterium]
MKYRKYLGVFLPHLFKKYLYRVETSVRNIFLEKHYACPICNSKLTRFNRFPDSIFELLDKHQYIHPFFYSETFNYLKYSCPLCGSSDRNRLYALFFKKRFSEIPDNETIYHFLDIAPNKNLTTWIKKFPFIQYRSVDLYKEDADDKADITDLNIYENEKFDIILCSHVLEHIKDDRKALYELFRVLKPSGYAIVMVPILLTLEEDLENSAWITEADRWKYYGQNDHIRMYSKGGFVGKLEKTGFKVMQLGVDFFGKETFDKYGIHHRSVLYVVEK